MKKKWIFTLITLIMIGMVHGQDNSTSVLYEELTPKDFRTRIAEAPIAYLPLGTIEWHGGHLPLGADGLQSKSFLETLATEVGGIVLPMYFLGPDISKVVDGKELYGMDTHRAKEHGRPEQQLDGSAYWISDSLFFAMVEATETSLLMAMYPELVQMENLPSDTAQWPLGVGGKDPRIYASPEVGFKAINSQKERMSKILRKALSEL